jgi:hypothetical protein
MKNNRKTKEIDREQEIHKENKNTNSCNFCKYKNGCYNLIDTINSSNLFYLTCVGNSLRLFNRHSYKGCYKINYCPICGRQLNDK